MILSAAMGKEIVVKVVNKIGVLADMAKALAEHGINIQAVCGYAGENNTAAIMLVSDDNSRATEALQKSGYKSAQEKEVVILELEDTPGAMKNISSKLSAQGIDIKYIYGTTCPKGCPARIILSTSDNEKALVAFKTK